MAFLLRRSIMAFVSIQFFLVVNILLAGNNCWVFGITDGCSVWKVQENTDESYHMNNKSKNDNWIPPPSCSLWAKQAKNESTWKTRILTFDTCLLFFWEMSANYIIIASLSLIYSKILPSLSDFIKFKSNSVLLR